MPKKTPPPFKLLKARKGQAVTHILVTVDLKGNTAIYELGSYETKTSTSLAESVTRARADDVDAEVYYAPIVLPIPKKARPVKTAKAKAKKIAKPKVETEKAKANAKSKTPRMKATRMAEPATSSNDDVLQDNPH